MTNKIYSFRRCVPNVSFSEIIIFRYCQYQNMYLPLQRKKNCVREFMQTAKEYTRKILLKTARETFLRKGFKATSMREISKLSGVGLSNIYNYYSCKDDLLAAILHPLFEAMDTML